MRKQALPIIVITLLTLVVWLFAEVESLTEVQANARLRFENFGEPAELLARSLEFDENLTITLVGSRGAIQRARSELDNAIILKPGDPAVPDVDGTHIVRLKDALAGYQPLVNAGVIIESVRPQRVEIQVDELVNIEIDIKPDLSGIVTQGEVTLTPSKARVRVPKRLATSLANTTLTARVRPERLDQATPGPRTESVPLELPSSIAGAEGVQLLTERVTVGFTLSSTITSRVFASVPVQVLLTTESARSWTIEIDPQQQLIPVDLTGSSELLDQIAGEGSRLVAVLALSDIELARGVTEKPVRLLVLRDNVPTPLPGNVTPTDALPSVRFTSTRIEQADGE